MTLAARNNPHFRRRGQGGSLWANVIQFNSFENNLVATVGNNLTVRTATRYIPDVYGPGYAEGAYNSNSGWNMPSLGSLAELTFGGRIGMFHIRNYSELFMQFGALAVYNSSQPANCRLVFMDSDANTTAISHDFQSKSSWFCTVDSTGLATLYVNGSPAATNTIPDYSGLLAEFVGYQEYTKYHWNSELIILNKAVDAATIAYWETFISAVRFSADNIDP